MVLEWKHWSNS